MTIRKNVKRSVCLLWFIYASVLTVSAQESRWLSLNRFSGFLTLQYQVTEEENTSEEILQYDVLRRFLEGGLQLSTSGSVYHPNFLSFEVDANIVGNRTKDRWISDESIHNTINNTYNIRLNFFRKKKINFQFFTLNNYTTSERRFRGRFFSRHSSTGITVKSRTKILPFSLSLYNSRNSIDALTYSERDEKSKNIDLRVDVTSGTKVNSFLVFKNKNFSETVSDIAYDSLEVLLNFRYHYGPKNINNMASTLSFHKMKGNYNFQLLRLAANSLHFFRRNLNLKGTYTLTTDKAFERSITRHELTGTLTHQLFESLTSSVLLGGRIEDAPVQRRDVLLGGFIFSYRKKISFGQVSFLINQKYENSFNKSSGDLQYEIEIFEFSFSDIITLIRPGININTIQVTDPGFSRIYIRDIDYQVNIVNNVVHISRLPGGDIPEDGSVAVHYAYLSFPDYRLRSSFQQINFTLAFLRYFQLYYRKHRNNHDVTSDYVTPLFDSYNRQIVGTRLSYKFLKVDYALEDYNSILSDYKANHIRASLSLGLFKRLRISGSISLSHLKYESGVLYNKFNTYSAHLNFAPSPRLDTRAVYRKIRYETSDYFRDRESLMFKIRWEFRKIILEAFYEHVFDGYQLDRRLHDFFSLAVKRRFGK